MKKKLFILYLLTLTLTGCSVTPIPNPGFRVATIRRQGSFERVLPYSVTKGENPQDGLSPTGNVTFFNKQASGSGTFDVAGGRAPAAWYITALSNWDDCNGDTAYIDLERGVLNYITCADLRIQFPITPSVVHTDSTAVQLQATLGGVNTAYGMPVFHFEDYMGRLVAAKTASWVNGVHVGVDGSDLVDKPVGRYTVKIYNATDPNISPSVALGTSSIMVSEPPPPTCYPQPGGIDQDTCEQVYGRTWNPMTCSCMF